MIGPFFETHVLGIMALLADTINDGKGPQPILEKTRCLSAIGEMIKLAKSHVSNGLPQVSPSHFRFLGSSIKRRIFVDMRMSSVRHRK